MQFFREVLYCCLLYCVVAVTRSKRYEDLCYTPESYIGVCVPLTYCPPLIELYAANGGSRQMSWRIVDYLRDIRKNCSYKRVRGGPVVCCADAYKGYQPLHFYQQQTQNHKFFTTPVPVEKNTPPPDTTNTTPFIPPTPPNSTLNDLEDRANNCRGPDARVGLCQSLVDCPELSRRLQANPNDQSFAQFLRQSNEACRRNGPIICCPIKADDPPIEVEIPTTKPSIIRNNSGARAKLLTPQEGCGQTGATNRRIVGGTPAKLGAWPWIALVGYTSSLGETTYDCGGSLITKRHVITAAHCINSSLRLVRLGEHNLATDSETKHLDVNVVRMSRHSGYRRSDGHSDIAILYLGRDVRFTKLISPICIPKRSDFATRSLVGFNPFVAGWGRTLEAGETSNILQEVQLPILSNDVCKKRFQALMLLNTERQFDEGIICAGVLAGGKDTCQGDSGGPLMLPEKLASTDQFYYNLIGIVAYGVGCARLGVPGVYANVPIFYDWIVQKVAEPI